MIGAKKIEDLQECPMMIHLEDANEIIDTLSALWRVAKAAAYAMDYMEASDAKRHLEESLTALRGSK